MEVTKSLSNLIKYYNFNVTEDDKKLIDMDRSVGNFIPGIFTHGAVEIRDLEQEEFDAEFPEEMFEQEKPAKEQELSPDELLNMAHDQVGQILEQAQRDAEGILEQARVTGEFEKNRIIEEGRKLGYQEGLIKANDELANQRKALQNREEELEAHYQQMIADLEPNFTELVIELVKKITGVFAERDIVIFLMEQALDKIGRCQTIKVRVSQDDIESVNASKDILLNIVGNQCQFDVLADAGLQKNQCVIETENQIVDCSLDVQLDSLIEDLKLLI